jgi:hypothetical protein
MILVVATALRDAIHAGDGKEFFRHKAGGSLLGFRSRYIYMRCCLV